MTREVGPSQWLSKSNFRKKPTPMISAMTPILASQLPPRICSHSLGLAGAPLAGGGGGGWVEGGILETWLGDAGGTVGATILGAGSCGGTRVGSGEGGDTGLGGVIDPSMRSRPAIRSLIGPTTSLRRWISSC